MTVLNPLSVMARKSIKKEPPPSSSKVISDDEVMETANHIQKSFETSGDTTMDSDVLMTDQGSEQMGECSRVDGRFLCIV